MLVRHSTHGGSALPQLHRRLRWVIAVIALAFAILIFRLVQLQLVRGDQYFQKTLRNVLDTETLPTVRGFVLDRNGKVLAENQNSYDISVRLGKYDAIEPLLVRVLTLDDIELASVRDRIQAARHEKRSSSSWIKLLDNQSEERVTALEQELSVYESVVRISHETYRSYPYGDSATHVLGYLGHPSKKRLAALRDQGITQRDWIGLMGVEKAFDDQLRGRKGIVRFVKNSSGRRVTGPEADELLQGRARRESPIAGHTVVLTLDIDLQRSAEAFVARYPLAALALMDIKTGQLLALVSKPAFDPNLLTPMRKPLARADLEPIQQDPRDRFIDKTLRQHYPPGSVFKFVAGLAALDTGAVDLEERIECKGTHEVGREDGPKDVFDCNGYHKHVNLEDALTHSCNVYFWKLAERVGLDAMAKVARQFGFGEASGAGINTDTAGSIPVVADYPVFQPGYAVNASTGQGDVVVTVVQVAMAYSALANGGDLYQAQIVRRVERADGEVLSEYPSVLRRHIPIKPEFLQALHKGMWRVVNEDGGTAFKYADSKVIAIAGKTGTAEVGDRRRAYDEYGGWNPGRDHAWFAGYAPAHAPEVAIAVIIPNGGSGAKAAAPVARKVFEAWARKRARTKARTAGGKQ